VPRNVERAVELVPGVELIDLDLIARHAPVAELSAEAEARGIVRDAVEEFSALNAEQDATPALVALRDHVYELLDDELQRLNPRSVSSSAPHAVADTDTSQPARHRAETEAALRHFVGRLLHRPSIRIRESGRNGNAAQARAAVELLFDTCLTQDKRPVAHDRR
jgi:glutamyl-tRNA reductase